VGGGEGGGCTPQKQVRGGRGGGGPHRSKFAGGGWEGGGLTSQALTLVGSALTAQLYMLRASPMLFARYSSVAQACRIKGVRAF